MKFNYLVGSNVGTIATVAVPAMLLCTEIPRRFNMGDISVRALGGPKGCAVKCLKVASRSLPEIAGLSCVLTIAVALRFFGDQNQFTDPMDIQVWEKIKSEWPVLIGADTLLNFQAMLRLLMYSFACFRAKDDASSPFAGVPAAIALAAVLARVSLASNGIDYDLEGPLSMHGALPKFCELAMIPMLAKMSLSGLRQSPITAVSVISMTTWYASHHYLNLASNPNVDKLFTCAHALEFVAAVAFLIRAITIFSEPKKDGAESHASTGSLSVGMSFLILPAQAALSAYYFLTAFMPAQELVGGGHPFCLLIWCNLLAMAVYLCSAGFYLAERLGSGSRSGPPPSFLDIENIQHV